MSPTLSPPDATPPPARPSWRRWFRRLAGMILILLLGPIAMLAFGGLDLETHWSQASRASTGQAPDPATTPEPLILVYGARAHNWRGAFGIHTWIATKRREAPHYTLYEVIGWNLASGKSVVTRRQGEPDGDRAGPSGWAGLRAHQQTCQATRRPRANVQGPRAPVAYPGWSNLKGPRWPPQQIPGGAAFMQPASGQDTQGLGLYS